MNKITATGRLAADAEMRYAPSGDPILNFRVASDVGFGDKKTTNWFSCQIWGKRGEALAKFLTKGQQVTIFGTLTLREWTNKEGVKAISPDVRIDEVELQGGRREEGQSSGSQFSAPAQSRSQPQQQSQGSSMGGPAFDDDIPFAPLSANAWML